MKLNWNKIASCTTGGKPFFYHGPNGAAVVWNRREKSYMAEYGGNLLAYVPTVRRAKAIVEAKAGA